MTFERKLKEIAHTANNRLMAALDAEIAAEREKQAAISEHTEVMTALRAVFPDSYESERGKTLETRATSTDRREL